MIDIGCGMGGMLHYMPKVKHVGFDMIEPYNYAASSGSAAAANSTAAG